MRTAGISPTRPLLTLIVVLFLAAGCSPAVGPLGTPSTPVPSSSTPVVIPSGDATPGPAESPTEAPSTSATPSSAPAASSTAPSATPTPAPTATPTPVPTATPAGTTVVRAYFLMDSSTGRAGLVPVLREVTATKAVATAAMNELIKGPDTAELGAQPPLSSDVPSSTRLLGLAISNGVATVDLSREFASGYNAQQPDARFAQVVFTLTQFSNVTSVAFELDGSPSGSPAGTRAGYYDAWLPAIFVDRPAWGASAGNPARISGVANVFEATFRIQVRGASGTVIADRQVMASCGTGCWGTFSTSIGYTVGKSQWGTLRVYDLSAKDGTPENVTQYPVWLTPAG